MQTLPPQSVEAEESILSAILVDNSTVIDIIEILEPEDFYRSAHKKIFASVCSLFRKTEPIDLVTLTNSLREEGHLEEIGGATYLARLLDSVPSAIDPTHYAKIIHDKASLRKLIAKANEITKRCFESGGELDRVIDFAEASIFEISENKNKQAFHPLGKIIETNIDALEERQGNRALVTGIPSGYQRIDQLTSGFQKSDLILVAARPAMGKTAFALNLARNAAIDGNCAVAIFSLEMSKEQLSMRMLCSEARVDSSRIRSGFLSREDWSKLTNAAGTLTEAPIYIDDSPDISSTSIRTKCRRLKMDADLGIIIVDYIQLMRGSLNTDRRDLEISEISRSLKLLAKELDVPVVALSQLNRKLEERADKRPQLSDLRESGALEQDADLVMFIYRDEVYNKDENNPNRGTAELIISKQRSGPTGMAMLAFLNTYTRFEDLATEAE